MKKLKLDLGELRVETFPAIAVDDASRGTVAGYADTYTCPPPSEWHSWCPTCEIWC
jgi:hypothetical protein